jgi:glycosyltransferase involved in cell wall biosynthesis
MTQPASPQITLIVPIYNGSRLLAELFDSVLAQTFPHWICLCVNDGSKDNSNEIIADYCKRDSRFQLINKENGGTGDSRNVGMAQATTPYIMFSDQDDLLHPQSFEIAHHCIETSGADLLQFELTCFNSLYKPTPYDVNAIHLTPITCLKNGLYPGNTICVWQYIYRLDAIGNCRFPKISGGEDHTFMYELAFKVEKWAKIPQSLYGARLNLNSTSRSMPLWYVDNAFTCYREVYIRSQKYQIDGNLIKSNILQWAFWFCTSVVFVHGRSKTSRELFQRTANNITRLKSEGILDVGLSYHGKLLLGLLTDQHFNLLSCLAWTIGLPSSSKSMLLFFKRTIFRLKDA